MKKKVKVPAIKKQDGKIIKAPDKSYSHSKLLNENNLGANTGQRGFVDSEDKFVNRGKAARIAKKAGQVDKDVKKLHSHVLRKGRKATKVE